MACRYTQAVGGVVDPQGGSENYAFDQTGNLLSKGTSYTTFCYNTEGAGSNPCSSVTNTRPHAVKQVRVGAVNRVFTYDANGNVTAATNSSYSSLTWWVSNLVKRVTGAGGKYSEFTYGPDRARYQQTLWRSATDTETTLYVGGAYERLTKVNGATTTVEHSHYIRAGSDTIAIWKRTKVGTAAPTEETRYLHRDHQGSVVALTNAAQVIERMAFEPWGKRRSSSTWDPANPTVVVNGSTYTKRGFTGHESVDELGFVHMNGRIYDPEIGKFLSADPTMQFPESTQGFNRYAYAGNNPLTNVDPSGFSFFKSLMKVVGWLNVIASFFLQPLSWLGAAINGFISGFLISGGDLKSGLIAGLTAGLTFGIGDKFTRLVQKASGLAQFGYQLAKAALEGIVGGVGSTLGGGRFKDGFLGAFAGSMASSRLPLSKNPQIRALQSIVIGGTASVIGGGKFGNGAAMAAFAALFNDLAHFQSYSVEEAIRNIESDTTLSHEQKQARLWEMKKSLKATGEQLRATPTTVRREFGTRTTWMGTYSAMSQLTLDKLIVRIDAALGLIDEAIWRLEIGSNTPVLGDVAADTGTIAREVTNGLDVFRGRALGGALGALSDMRQIADFWSRGTDFATRPFTFSVELCNGGSCPQGDFHIFMEPK
jgi:RHS repeat-associated protein